MSGIISSLPLVLRSSCLVIAEILGCNPNGDPDWDGSPRIVGDRLWMSDVSIKRKHRNLFVDHESVIFRDLQRELGFDPERFHIFESLTRGYPGVGPLEAKRMALKLCATNPEASHARNLDMRLYGTLPLDGDNKEEKKGKKPKKPMEGEDKKEGDFVAMKRTGPVTISHAISVAPVILYPMSITKMAPLRDQLLEDGQGDMAPSAKKVIQHAVVVARIAVNPAVAREVGTTVEDIEAFKKSFKYIFSTSASASRPAGSINLLHMWWADHTNSLGSFNECNFWNALRPIKLTDPEKPSMSLSEYKFPTPQEMGLNYNVVDLAQYPS
jgi:CRISPR-associated protein Csd2